MGPRMVPANGQTTKTKKNLLYVVLVGKTFHLITNIYICVQFLFSKRGGGVCFYWVACFYWDIYGMYIDMAKRIAEKQVWPYLWLLWHPMSFLIHM